MDLAEKVLHGDERSASRLITLIENGATEGYDAVADLFPRTGDGYSVGITGTPGAGKSTLVDKLAVCFSEAGRSVGIIGIDPTSPATRGALLGDRIRMTGAEKRAGIFIRSMAHRGYPGGIAKAALGAVYVLQALGKEIVFVESVGVGQTDLGISAVCDMVITVFTPDYGDEIQLMKAGLMEVGDIVVVNKGDYASSCDVAQQISLFLSSRGPEHLPVPVLVANALTGEGTDEICRTVGDYHSRLRLSGTEEAKRREKRRLLTLSFLKELLWKQILTCTEELPAFREIMNDLNEGKMDPYRAAEALSRTIRIEGRC